MAAAIIAISAAAVVAVWAATVILVSAAAVVVDSAAAVVVVAEVAATDIVIVVVLLGVELFVEVRENIGDVLSACYNVAGSCGHAGYEYFVLPAFDAAY